MSHARVKLKNRNESYALVDEKVLEDLEKNEYLSSLKFTENLRAHSNGYAIFQRCVTTKQGPVFETIYLHRFIAEKYIKKPKDVEGKLLVHIKNGNVLDCRIENLEWTTMGLLRRATAPTDRNAVGYRGVLKEGKRFKAVIYQNKKILILGFFETAEDAARAYNAKSRELYGDKGTVNPVD